MVKSKRLKTKIRKMRHRAKIDSQGRIKYIPEKNSPDTHSVLRPDYKIDTNVRMGKGSNGSTNVIASAKDNIESETRRFKAELSRKASMANKRLRRLEDNNLTENPAYTQWKNYKGGVNFSVKGKSFNELQAEMARVDKFLNSKTSTVRGSKQVMKDLADTAGISYDNTNGLNSKLRNFFELADKTDQYLKNVKHMGEAIGYQKIWETINKYVDDQNIDLSSSKIDVEDYIEDINNLLSEQYTHDNLYSDFDEFNL